VWVWQWSGSSQLQLADTSITLGAADTFLIKATQQFKLVVCIMYKQRIHIYTVGV